MKTHPVSVGWRRGVNNGAHLFQSTADIDIQNAHKTRKNAWNAINYLSLLRFSLLLPNCEGLHSAFIYKFKYKKISIRMHPWKAHLVRTCADGEGVSFGGGMTLSRIKPQQCICVTCYTPTRTQSYRHICKCSRYLLTY